MKRLNVLVSAHEFSPYQGSECAEGWNIVTRLTKYHNITVLYATGNQFLYDNYKNAVEKYFLTNPHISGLTLVNVDQPWVTKLISVFNRPFLKGSSIGLPFLYFKGYNFWQKRAYRVALKLHRTKKFDITHQLTQISFREPGYMWKMDIPFFWGPTGGTTSLPKEFLRLLSLKSRIFENIRTVVNSYQFNYVKRIKQANAIASVIYSFSNEDALLFGTRSEGKIKLLLDAGTYNIPERKNLYSTEQKKLTGVWCGQIIERKGLIILLNSLSMLKPVMNEIKIIIIGDGPLRLAMQKRAEDLKLDNIEWIKSVNHDDIFNIMRGADFFIHTSLREATSNVIPEAISTGLPVICHDINGMSIAVNEDCGIKIPMVSPDESIKGFKNAISLLRDNPDEVIRLKSGAIKRALELSWDKMAETVSNDYLEVLNSNNWNNENSSDK